MQTDDAVGRVLQQLDELNATQDTLVIFTTDNGFSSQSATPGALWVDGYKVDVMSYASDGDVSVHEVLVVDGTRRNIVLTYDEDQDDDSTSNSSGDEDDDDDNEVSYATLSMVILTLVLLLGFVSFFVITRNRHQTTTTSNVAMNPVR